MSQRPINLSALRKRAKKMIERKQPEYLGATTNSLAGQDASHLIEELRVYQTELEVQNQELSKAQSEIAKTLEKYRTLFEYLPLPGVLVDIHGFIVEANFLACQLLGLRRNATLQQRSALQLFDSAARSQIYKILRDRSNSTAQTVELVSLKTTQGNYIPCDVHVLHLNYEIDQAGQTLLVLVDRSAEIALQKSKEFKNAILDSMSAQIAVLDQDGVIVSVNEAWRRFASENGSDPQKTSHVGINYLDVCHGTAGAIPPEGAKEAYEGVLKVLNGQLPGFSVDYPCHSPTEQRWFTMAATPLGGKGMGVVISHTNITESKRAEMAASDSQETLRSILKTTRDGFWRVSSSGHLIDVNGAYCQQSGYTSNELLGMHFSKLLAEGEAEATQNHIQQLIKAGNDQFESLHQRKDGTLWHVEISATYRELAGGEALVFLRDITERKCAEAELNTALEAAKRADQAKDEFLANITHELRTPLSAVIGFSSLARPLSTDPLQNSYLEKVNNAGHTLASIIDDLLDLSKIVSGHLVFEATPFSFRQLVTRSISLIGYKAEEKGLDLRHSIDEHLADVLIGDSLRIEQILLNLLSNAVKFTNTGYVELRVSQPAIELNRACLRIEVEDSGIGLSEDELALMFKPFSQADASVTRKFGGTGLGLSICKRLAESMDGKIAVSSQKGEGTTFQVEIWLGLAEMETTPQTVVEEDLPSAHYHDARVLVVDDQPYNREIVEGLLATVGIAPNMASNGQEAIDILLADTGDFDLVLMDIQMPVMDGLTATRIIRQTDRFAHLPIIAMTAHTMAREKEKSKVAGMNGHIGKPFDENGFYRLLAKWIPLEKQRINNAPLNRTPNSTPGFPKLLGIDTKDGLALLLGDETRYRHWLNDFVAEAPVAIEKIRQALASGQSESASMVAHSLKGRMGMLGMKNLHAIAGALEAAIDSSAETEEVLFKLDHGVACMRDEIRNKLGSTGDTLESPDIVPTILPKSPLPDSVRQLLISLSAGDSDCDKYATDCLAELEGTAWATPVKQALKHIQNFDFAAAIRLLSGEK
jgi:PAS domain S-box-containing protein